GFVNRRKRAAIVVAAFVYASAGQLPFVDVARMMRPIVRDLVQMAERARPIAGLKFGSDLRAAPPVPQAAVLIHPFGHLDVSKDAGGVWREEAEARLDRADGFSGFVEPVEHDVAVRQYSI